MSVKILPPEIISKIAAGEVIERPASVIKELVENAFDAGTRDLELHLEQAGKTRIHIKDTGHGIPPNDLETIFQRHATSKISAIDDLWDIRSLGFRGEALYSIAAIADVTLRSRTAEEATGWEVHLRGGQRQTRKPVPMSPGTELEIKELFFNTPARRKFLKTNTTEMHHILNIVIPYALLHPDCRFLVTHQGRALLDLDPAADLAQRMAAALNINNDFLIDVQKEFPDHHLNARLLLGDINLARPRRDLQFIFVNHRPVQNKNISFHLNNIYRLLLPPNAYPCFAVFLDLPPADLDVNIHPTKREIKIKQEQTLCSLLRHLTEAALLTSGQAKQAQPGTEVRKDEPTDTGAPGDQQASPSPIKEPAASFSSRRSLSAAQSPAETFDGSLPADIFDSPTLPAGNDTKKPKGAAPYRPEPTEQYNFPTGSPDTLSLMGRTLQTHKKQSLTDKLQQARFIGSLINKFLLFESGSSLLVIDQHAAQERITFEYLIRQMDQGRVEVQHLLTPYLLKLTPNELLIWEENQSRLDQMGFASTPFDPETIAVHTHPVLIKDPERAVRDILAGGKLPRSDNETLARRACRASIRTGDRLHAKQAEGQRQQLLDCRDPFTCPHGRPTVIEMTENFLDKQFLRT